jgi:hypothetical protein
MSKPIDLARFATKASRAKSVAKSEAKAPAPRINGPFLRGPLPVKWLEVAGRGGGSAAILVGLALWRISGVRHNARAFPVSNVELRIWGIDKHKKRRGIEQLEHLGLIRTEQIGLRSVRVTILCTHGEEPEPPPEAGPPIV